MIRARKFFYLFYDDATGRVDLKSTVKDRYESLVAELTLNGCQPLFAASYEGIVSRMIYKYLLLLTECHQKKLLDEYTAAINWQIVQPWLLYDHRAKQFFQSGEPVWQHGVDMVGYVGSRSIVDLLCKTDLI